MENLQANVNGPTLTGQIWSNLERARKAYEKAYREAERAVENYQRVDADLDLSRAEVRVIVAAIKGLKMAISECQGKKNGEVPQSGMRKQVERRKVEVNKDGDLKKKEHWRKDDFELDPQAAALSAPEQLSSKNETLERQNLKSILEKLSASSKAGSSETSATSTSDHEAETAELKKLMRKPTIEDYAARHSKLSKSVTFNKCTLQSPPSSPLPCDIRPLSRLIIPSLLMLQENIQRKFELQFMSLELEIRKRDEIIRIQEMKRRKADDFGGDSTEQDAFMEEIECRSRDCTDLRTVSTELSRMKG
ncbi:hypothetical protein ALC60_02328 [Trachymyrmex zeteki]|uniref:Uncharacterized protein n=1 Tax=Mycetomoellerius zeteki TaxID=64791 RepID=A0A151XE83_9HYME|nr:hypothetical protein ALC60_02328 [Trachymyrmex zeteki]